MNTAKPQQPADGRGGDPEDLITELARMMATGTQEPQSEQADEKNETPEPPRETSETAQGGSVRIPGQPEQNPVPSNFKFDFNVPKAPAVAAPEPLVNWQERLSRSSAPASTVRLEPTLERVPVETEKPGPAPSFVAPRVPQPQQPQPVPRQPVEPQASQPEPEPEPEAEPQTAAPVEDDHDAIADLIAAELDGIVSHAQTQPIAEPVEDIAPEPEPEPPPSKPLLRAVNYPTQPRQESDRFVSPPVFGVGTRAADPAPEPPIARSKAPLDPMDEIENLIGAAIQSDHGIRNVVAPPPAASTPPARDLDDDAAHHAAEAAILAAAAATGVKVSRVAAESRFEPPEADEVDIPAAAVIADRGVRRRFGFRPFIGPIVAGVLLVAAGLGLYWVLGMGRGDGTAPVLTADSTPAKQAPEKAAAPATPAASSAVFNELEGRAPDADEQLVSRDQSTGKEETPAPAAANDDGDGLANRKVRTVTVRPDGTIVNAEDALAGAQALPVDRPNVPDVPNGNLDASDLLTAAAQPQQTTPPASATPAAAANDEFANAPIDPNAPVPMPRPADRAALQQPGTAVASTAPANDLIGNLAAGATTPAATNTPQQASGSTSAPAYVQLSSQRDQNVAQQSLIEINQRWGNLLKGTLPEVQRVDLGARGIYYRVRVPADSLASANFLCQQIKSSKGDCIVTN